MLLAGIMGHNLCVDIFGGPSDAEAAAGMTPHGEASVVRYELNVSWRDRSRRRPCCHAPDFASNARSRWLIER